MECRIVHETEERIRRAAVGGRGERKEDSMSSGGGRRGGSRRKRSLSIVGGIDAEKRAASRIRLRGEVDKKEKKLGVGDFDEEAISVLEDAKDCGTIDSIAKGKAGSGGAMPLCGIVLPLSKGQRESACSSMPFSPFIHVRSRETHSNARPIITTLK